MKRGFAEWDLDVIQTSEAGHGSSYCSCLPQSFENAGVQMDASNLTSSDGAAESTTTGLTSGMHLTVQKPEADSFSDGWNMDAGRKSWMPGTDPWSTQISRLQVV